MKIETNCRELVDNVADKAHFGPVRGASPSLFTNVFEGHTAAQVMRTGSERLAADTELTTVATYYGPAYQITEMNGTTDGYEIRSVLLNCHVPIDMDSFTLPYGVLVKKIPGPSDEQNQEIARAYVKQAQDAFYEDVDIWHNKIRVDNPVLCSGDGLVYQLRTWYQQFYTDVADLPADLAERTSFACHIAFAGDGLLESSDNDTRPGKTAHRI